MIHDNNNVNGMDYHNMLAWEPQVSFEIFVTGVSGDLN